MGSLPQLQAPQIETPYESLGKLAQLRQMGQNQQLQQQEIQQRQMEQAEQKKMQQAILAAGGVDAGIELYEKQGGNPMFTQKIRQSRVKEKQDLLALDKDKRAVQAERLKKFSSAIAALKKLPPAARPQAYGQVVQMYEIEGAPPQYPGDQMLDFFALATVDAEKQMELADREAGRTHAATEAEKVRNAPTSNEKDFQAWYKAQLEGQGIAPNAQIEMQMREQYRQQQKSQLLTPEEESQKKRLRPEQTIVMPTVDAEGNAVRRIVPKVAGAEYAAGPTAEMRNKDVARQKLVPAFNSLEQLSQKVITEKLAIVQRTKAAGRSIDAALADDPEYRTYQDARKAFALQLAVATQGSRPSDTDMIALLNLIPDVFKDTKMSAQMKWDMLKTQMQIDGGQGAGKETRQHEGYEYTKQTDGSWKRGRKL